MKSLRDAATLGILILVALTVRVGPVEGPLEFDAVQAAEIGQEAAEPTDPPELPSGSCFLDATPPNASFPVIVETESTEPVRYFVRTLDDDRRVLIILETEAAPEDPSPPGPVSPAGPDPECGVRQAHVSC